MKTPFGFYDDARADLAAVTNSIYTGMRLRLERSVVDHETAAANPAVRFHQHRRPNERAGRRQVGDDVRSL